MEHLTVKATTTTTDQELGTFTALVSAWTADREGDTIDRHAFDQSVADWKASGKMLPLLLEHKTTVVGALDPATMRTEERGLVVAGSVDRESDEGQRVWRAIKSNVASFQHRLHGGQVTPARRRWSRVARDRPAGGQRGVDADASRHPSLELEDGRSARHGRERVRRDDRPQPQARRAVPSALAQEAERSGARTDDRGLVNAKKARGRSNT